jgi:hypothetical protein
VKASYKVSRIPAKKMKPFTNGQAVKECMVVISELMFREIRRHIDDISLSRLSNEAEMTISHKPGLLNVL